MQIKSIYYINADDIRELTGKHWSDFEFAQMAENDSYVRLDCSDAGLEELYEEQDWLKDKESGTYERLTNQIQLVEILRKNYGFMFEILVWISW